MHKYQAFVVGLWAFSILLFIPIFGLIGNPFQQKLIQYDQTRLQNFSELSTDISTYVGQHQMLPKNLESISYATGKTDPQTGKQYDYKPVADNGMSFQLCTTFSLTSSDDGPTSALYSATTQTHKKGYDCITYTLPAYLITPTEAPTPTIGIFPTSLPLPTTAASVRGASTHACSTVYRGTCRPSCKTGEYQMVAEDANGDCSVNSKDNPTCCVPLSAPTP
jgi:hypothetical protein